MVIVHSSSHGRESKVGNSGQGHISKSEALFPLVPITGLDLELGRNNSTLTRD